MVEQPIVQLRLIACTIATYGQFRSSGDCRRTHVYKTSIKIIGYLIAAEDKFLGFTIRRNVAVHDIVVLVFQCYRQTRHGRRVRDSNRIFARSDASEAILPIIISDNRFINRFTALGCTS